MYVRTYVEANAGAETAAYLREGLAVTELGSAAEPRP